jgi:hypothetical protein
MNNEALAEALVALYEDCRLAWKRHFGDDPSPTIAIALFEQAHAQLLSNRAHEDRVAMQKQKQKKMGEPATDAQMKYIIDLDGDPKWTGTKQEACSYIDRLKKK